jgi:hypothetical protein
MRDEGVATLIELSNQRRHAFILPPSSFDFDKSLVGDHASDERVRDFDGDVRQFFFRQGGFACADARRERARQRQPDWPKPQRRRDVPVKERAPRDFQPVTNLRRANTLDD